MTAPRLELGDPAKPAAQNDKTKRSLRCQRRHKHTESATKFRTRRSPEEQVLCSSRCRHGGARSPQPCRPREDPKLLFGVTAFPAPCDLPPEAPVSCWPGRAHITEEEGVSPGSRAGDTVDPGIAGVGVGGGVLHQMSWVSQNLPKERR